MQRDGERERGEKEMQRVLDAYAHEKWDIEQEIVLCLLYENVNNLIEIAQYFVTATVIN